MSKINRAYIYLFTVCWSSQKDCEHLLTLINKETGMVIGDVSNLPMYYCNTCGNDTLDISERPQVIILDSVLKLGAKAS